MTTHPHAHDHASRRAGEARALGLVLGLTVLLAVGELIGGLIGGSLALLADAGHMLSDVGSLALALGALWLAARPPTARLSFGFRRAEILAALLNGVALVAIAIWIFVEAAQRLSDPPEILAGVTLAVALAGLAVNVLGVVILRRSGGRSLNMRAALRHVVADLLGSVGVIVAALVILATGWLYADPLVSVLIGVLVLASSWRVLRESLGVLLEAAPEGIDADAVGRRMAAVEGVSEVHDLHIWTITSGFPALSAHVLVPEGEDCHARRRELSEMLRRDFGIAHTTLQVEHGETLGTPVRVRLSERRPT
ncbi:MAG TPA: cation diffusion facilitator family transporter [Miltoncostaeaceae bacterium]|nr:cation diffusion facilitator family transporter [Miltoncostaeaceae bacterium]